MLNCCFFMWLFTFVIFSMFVLLDHIAMHGIGCGLLLQMYIPGVATPDSRDRNRCGLYHLVDHWSVKKPINVDLNLSSPDLNALRDAESLTC